jgi:hypothetical protein
VALLVTLAACSSTSEDPVASAPTTTTVEAITTTTIEAIATTTTIGAPATPVTHPELRVELLEMRIADQQERTGEGLPPGTKLGPPQDFLRAERLKEIIAEHGWPTIAMVGADGASAAWLVAQHADHDLAFQQAAVELLRTAVIGGQGDPIDLAYLEDRTSVNGGQPQVWGTQVRCRDGRPDPATPIVDQGTVDERRAAVGLGSLADYHAELAMACADEAAAGVELTP